MNIGPLTPETGFEVVKPSKVDHHRGQSGVSSGNLPELMLKFIHYYITNSYESHESYDSYRFVMDVYGVFMDLGFLINDCCPSVLLII